MATDKLGERVQHDIGAMLDRAAEVRRREGIVDDERELVFMRNGRHLLDVEHVAARVRDGLAVKALRLRRDRATEVFGVIGLHKSDANAHAPEGDVELRVGAAVERRRGYDVVAGLADIGDGEELRRLPGGDGQRSHAAFQRSDAFFQHGCRRVHDARVDVAEFLEGKQLGGVFGVVEDEGGRLVNGNGPRLGGRVDGIARMKGAGVEAQGAFRVSHGPASLSNLAGRSGELIAIYKHSAKGIRPQRRVRSIGRGYRTGFLRFNPC